MRVDGESSQVGRVKTDKLDGTGALAARYGE